MRVIQANKVGLKPTALLNILAMQCVIPYCIC